MTPPFEDGRDLGLIRLVDLYVLMFLRVSLLIAIAFPPIVMVSLKVLYSLPPVLGLSFSGSARGLAL